MARRMSGEGLVTVSLRRSIMLVCSLAIPLAVEHFDGGASHIDLIIGLVPFEFQASTAQVPGHPASGTTGEMTGHRHAAPVPQARVSPEPRSQTRMENVWASSTRTNSVLTPSGKAGGAQSAGPTTSTSGVIHEYDTVRVAHRDRRDQTWCHRPPAVRAAPAGPCIGIWARSSRGSPIFTQTFSTTPWLERVAVRARPPKSRPGWWSSASYHGHRHTWPGNECRCRTSAPHCRPR